MSKEFALQTELHQFITNLIEGGFIVKWEKRNLFGSFVEKPPAFQYITVTIELISVLLIICINLIAGSILMLIAEFIIYKRVRTHGAARIWRFIEMMIDPYRHFLLNDLTY